MSSVLESGKMCNVYDIYQERYDTRCKYFRVSDDVWDGYELFCFLGLDAQEMDNIKYNHGKMYASPYEIDDLVRIWSSSEQYEAWTNYLMRSWSPRYVVIRLDY